MLYDRLRLKFEAERLEANDRNEAVRLSSILSRPEIAPLLMTNLGNASKKVGYMSSTTEGFS